MKPIAMRTLGMLAVIVALAGAGTAAATESRSEQRCADLFHRLNTSGTGRLTLNEAIEDPVIARELDDPFLWRNGYVTKEEFVPLCMRGKSTANRSAAE